MLKSVLSLSRLPLALLMSLLAWPCLAQSEAGVGTGQVLTLLLGLALVLVLIVGCAWLVKRITGLQGTASGKIRVVAVLPVGGRERIALIDVAGQQLLVGVTATQITLLHSFDEAPVELPSANSNSDFAQKLHRLISNR